MPEPTQTPGKKRVSTTALVILCGLLLLLSLAAAVIFPVVREVRFIERMEAEGFLISDKSRTEFDWGPFDRWNRSAYQIFDYNKPNELPASLRPIRNSQTLGSISLQQTTMSQDHLAELGTLKNLRVFKLDSQVTPDFATSLPRHFPNLEYFSIPLDSDNIKALSRTPLAWRQNITSITSRPSSVLEGNDIETLVDAFPNLMRVYLHGNDLGKVDLSALASRPFELINLDQSQTDLSQLRGCEVASLSLRDNQYQSADLAPLAGSRINHLYLDNPRLDDRLATTLLAIKDLEVLGLEAISFTTQGYTLAKHPSLKMISIAPNQHVPEQARSLFDANKIQIIKLR